MPKYKKQPIDPKLRQKVFKRDNYTCRYCGSTKKPLHCDHVYPERHGGKAVMGNLVTACKTCNYKKHDKIGIWPPSENDVAIKKRARQAIARKDSLLRQKKATIEMMARTKEIESRKREDIRTGVQVYLLFVSALSFPGLLYGIEHNMFIWFSFLVVLWIPLISIFTIKIYSRVVDRAVSKQVKQMNGVIREVTL